MIHVILIIINVFFINIININKFDVLLVNSRKIHLKMPSAPESSRAPWACPVGPGAAGPRDGPPRRSLGCRPELKTC